MRIVFKPMGVAVVLAIALGLGMWFLRIADRPTGKQVAAVRKSGVAISAEPDARDRWTFEQRAPSTGSLSAPFPVDTPGGKKSAARITVTKATPQQPTSVQVFCDVADAFAVGQNLSIRFYARSPESKSCVIQFGQNHAPYEKEFVQRLELTPQWKYVEIPFRPALAYASKEARFSIQVGDSVGTVECTEVVIYDPAAP